MSNKELSADQKEKVLALPKTEINGKVSSIAHVDVCSAKIKLGGIYVAVYPIVDGHLKGPREVRQKEVMNSTVRKNVVSFAKSKKRKQKAKKKPLSAEKYVPGRISFINT
jgi:hypothetical protein